MSRRLRYYILFATGFSLCSFLIKLGWTHNAGKALPSSIFETFMDVAALLCTVEWLMPRYFYRSQYGRFGLGLGLIVFLAGTANVLVQLRIFVGSNLLEYHVNIARYMDLPGSGRGLLAH